MIEAEPPYLPPAKPVGDKRGLLAMRGARGSNALAAGDLYALGVDPAAIL